MKIVCCLLLGGAAIVASFGMHSVRHDFTKHREHALPRCRPLNDGRTDVEFKETSATEALSFLEQAKALRAEASALRKQLQEEKEERIRKEIEKVDTLIDMLLFHGSTNYDGHSSNSTETRKEHRSKAQLMNTEEQVAELLISKRLNYEQVNQMFDRICELANRPQSIDSCSPLLSLLLDAACKVDCLERDENPNKRWNHRVERNLRRKLFALGYGIRIEDVQKKNDIRSITGEKDYY